MVFYRYLIIQFADEILPLFDTVIKGSATRLSLQSSVLMFLSCFRMDTILESDKVIVMSKGIVIEFDDPVVLMSNTKSMFYSLVNGISK